jgi:hypothetical protein
MRTGPFAVGDDVAGRVTNQPTLPFARPIRGQDDRPGGPPSSPASILTSIDIARLAGNLSASGLPPDALPPDATLTVADRNGAILTRADLVRLSNDQLQGSHRSCSDLF